VLPRPHPPPFPPFFLPRQLRTGRGIGDVLSHAQADEMAHRAREAARLAQQSARLADESAGTSQASAAIMMRWDDLKLRELPEELAAALEEQRSACAGVLARKAALVAHLNAEAARKDEAFAMLLDAQRASLDVLAGRMRAQFLEHRDATGAQLREVEAAFLREREELLAAHRRELDALLDTRRTLEEGYVEDRLAREEGHAAELYATQAADLENYQKLKVKLERDVMLLEQQLEAMKFTYILNKGAWRAARPPPLFRARPARPPHLCPPLPPTPAPAQKNSSTTSASCQSGTRTTRPSSLRRSRSCCACGRSWWL
jgi:dynein regulatory complex protein 1